MDGIITMAVQWLEGSKKNTDTSVQMHIVESLLSEIERVETKNAKLHEELQRIRGEQAKELRRSTAEECAVICETADYAMRSYGCAREIRKRFGLSN